MGWLGDYWLAEVERPIHITSPSNDQYVSLRQQVLGSYKDVGSPTDAGKAFDILLVLVDNQGQQGLASYLAGNHKNGIKGLPRGTTIVD